jgi:hypothetical protein
VRHPSFGGQRYSSKLRVRLNVGNDAAFQGLRDGGTRSAFVVEFLSERTSPLRRVTGVATPVVLPWCAATPVEECADPAARSVPAGVRATEGMT